MVAVIVVLGGGVAAIVVVIVGGGGGACVRHGGVSSRPFEVLELECWPGVGGGSIWVVWKYTACKPSRDWEYPQNAHPQNIPWYPAAWLKCHPQSFPSNTPRAPISRVALGSHPRLLAAIAPWSDGILVEESLDERGRHLPSQ